MREAGMPATLNAERLLGNAPTATGLRKMHQASQMQRYQLKKYMNNKVQRIDLQVLARLCYVLECNVEDILEYKE